MPPDHNQQHSRRPHYHRGRRGPDRRSGDRRPPQQQQQQEPAHRDQLDVEQIMREIRSRISERHGIDLTAQQIQDLAARRLEAILDPRTIKPSLMDELRRASGLPADTPSSDPENDEPLTESALYKSDNGFVRALRKLLNPLLKLLFNPTAIVDALNTQARRAKAAEAREAELRGRQTEWNALHFEILRRLVTDVARVEIDNQHLAHRVESLTAKVDFNERRVRGLEHTQHQARPSIGRVADATVAPIHSPAPAPREETSSSEQAVSSDASPDGTRRRRRRRRGRRSGQLRDISGAAIPAAANPASVDQGSEGDEFEDDAGEELIEEIGATSIVDEATVVDFSPAQPPAEPPVPFEPPSVPEESLQSASAPDTQGTAAAESSPASPLDPAVERPDRVPPERS
jgi:hypothetical protein